MTTRRVCVCGRQRGRNPVIISITTCNHKNSPRKVESLTIGPPLATSSPIKLPPKKKQSKVKAIASKLWIFNKGKKKSGESITAEDQTGSAYKTSIGGDSTNQSFRTVDDSRSVSSYRSADGVKSNKTLMFNDTVDQSEIPSRTMNATMGSGYSADESSKFQDSTLYKTAPNDISPDSTKITKKSTIMFLTETAINTMPFLDNLFWTKSTSSKSMPNLSSEDCAGQEHCSLEVFVFEKHSKQCRHFLNSEGITKNNSFFDGDTLFDTLGRISFPVRCDDFRATKSEKLAAIYSQLKENFAKTRDPLNTFDKFVKNRQFFTNLNSRSEPLNIKLQKFITMGNDVYEKKVDDNNSPSNTDIKEIYFRKETKDEYVQYEFSSSINTKTKWYSTFLLCFGLKNSDELIKSEADDNVKGELSRKSSLLITKYLRV